MDSTSTKICTFTTLRAPYHETLMFVNYHLNIGVDHMYLFFDDPNDLAIDDLVHYDQITCVRCDSNYWEKQNNKNTSIEERQRINGNTALKWARQNEYDWFFDIDSDELIFTNKPLKLLLAKYKKNIHVVNFPTMEAVPEKLYYDRVFEGVTLFKTHFGTSAPSEFHRSKVDILQFKVKKSIYQLRHKLASFLGCPCTNKQKTFFKGHTNGKSAVRIDAGIKSTGLHFPVPIQDQILNVDISSEGRLLHFDCCGFESWKKKWIRRVNGTATAKEMGANRQEQYQKFISSYKENTPSKMIDLYKQEYFLSSKEKKILYKLGLLKHIQLHPQLFELDIANRKQKNNS